MKLFSPLEVAPGVYQLRAIGARVTALLDDDGVVLVDAGGRGSQPTFPRSAAWVRRNPVRVLPI